MGKKIESLENQEIEEEILRMNNSQIRDIKRSSLLNILISLDAVDKILKDEKVEIINKHKKEKESLLNIIEDAENLLLNPKKDLTYKNRNEIITMKKILEGYIVELYHIGELVDEHGMKILSKDERNKAYHSMEEMITLIENSLNSSREDYNKYVFIISEIINILPMNMVKANYYDIVKNTLLRNLSTLNKVIVDISIENYKKQFDSSTKDGYGTRFDYFFMEIQKLKKSKLEEKTLDELSEDMEKILKLTEELNLLQDLIMTLGIIYNLIIVINLGEEIDIDLEETIKEFQEKRNEEEYLKGIRKEVLEIESKIQKDLVYYEELTVEVSKREDFNHDRLEEDLLEVRNILTYYNDIGITEQEYLEGLDLNVVSLDYLESRIDDLISYIERSIIGMSNMERKVRMRKLLSVIDLPFKNLDDFIGYIRYSLNERVVDREIITFKINQIIHFLNELMAKK